MKQIDPLITELLEKHGGVKTAASVAAGFHKSYLNKVMGGHKPFTEASKERVRAALGRSSQPKSDEPKKERTYADPDIAKLIGLSGGSLAAAADAAGINKSQFGKLARGQVKITELLKGRILKALTSERPSPKRVAENVVKGVSARAKSGRGPAKIDPANYKNAPAPLKKLMKAHGWNFHAAGAASNINHGYLNEIAKGNKPYSRGIETRIKAALAGNPMPKPQERTPAIRENAAVKTAIVIARVNVFEQLYDVAQALNGVWAFKRKAGTHWIGVIQMSGSNLVGFLALASAKGVEHHTT